MVSDNAKPMSSCLKGPKRAIALFLLVTAGLLVLTLNLNYGRTLQQQSNSLQNKDILPEKANNIKVSLYTLQFTTMTTKHTIIDT